MTRHPLKKHTPISISFLSITVFTLLVGSVITNNQEVIAENKGALAPFSLSIDPSSYEELGKNMLSVSVSSSTKSSLGESVQFSFTSGYDSFKCNLGSTVIESGPDMTTAEGSEFQKFYYDGTDDQKAFNMLGPDELLERTKELQKDPSKVNVYPSFIRSIGYTATSTTSQKNKLFIPRVTYRCDTENPYRSIDEQKEMSDADIATPILTLGEDKIYVCDSVIYFGLAPNAVSNQALKSENADKINEVIIPNTIKSICTDSFFYTDSLGKSVGLNETTVFKMEMSQKQVEDLEKSGDFASGWHGQCEVVYDYDYKADWVQELDASKLDQIPLKDQKSSRTLKRKVSYPATTVGTAYDINPDPEMAGKNNYILGSYPEKPLTAVFSVKDNQTDEVIGTTNYEFPKPSSYYSVGNQIYKFSVSLYADMAFENLYINETGKVFDAKTMNIDPKNCSLFNIFHAERKETGFFPEVDKPYKVTSNQSLKIAFNKVNDLKDYLNFTYNGYSSFAGFIAVNFTVNKTNKEIFKELNPSSYKQYESGINAGYIHVRYRMDSLKQAQYRFKVKGIDEYIVSKVTTPVKQFEITNDNNSFAFLFNPKDIGYNFNGSDIISMDLLGAYVNLDLSGNNGPIARTSVSTRFGFISIQDSEHVGNNFNGDLFLILLMIGYVVLYVVGSLIIFVITKNKYKNDEFRRVKPKKFFKTAAIGLLAVGIILLAIIFIIYRCTLFNNAIVVYNPVDPFIISFGVVSVVVIGYLIKYFVTVGKANKARREAIRLKLNEDEVDDGTN